MGKTKETYNLIEGPAAQKLAQFIPIENIKLYYYLYKIIKHLDLKALKDYNFKGKGKQLKKFAILYHNNKITKHYFLNKLTEITSHEMIEGMVKRRLKSFGRPCDNALYILLFAIRFDLISYSGKPQYKLIEEFLTEQKITTVMSYDDLKHKFKRVLKAPICHWLSGYQDAFNVIIEAFEIARLERVGRKGFYTYFDDYVTHETKKLSAKFRGNKSLKK